MRVDLFKNVPSLFDLAANHGELWPDFYAGTDSTSSPFWGSMGSNEYTRRYMRTGSMRGLFSTGTFIVDVASFFDDSTFGGRGYMRGVMQAHTSVTSCLIAACVAGADK